MSFSISRPSSTRRGWYDDFEVDRVANVEVKPKPKQGELVAAIAPVADRLLKRFKAAHGRKLAAIASNDEKAAKDANDELEALLLFKNDIGAFQRLYSFLSQIFDYGNTAIEKRSCFTGGSCRCSSSAASATGIDLSKVKLTHHGLKTHGSDAARARASAKRRSSRR